MSRAKVSTDGSDIDRSPPRQLLRVPSIFRSKGASIRPGGGIEKRLEGPRRVQVEASHAVGSRVDRRTYVMRHGAPGEGARDARPFTPGMTKDQRPCLRSTVVLRANFRKVRNFQQPTAERRRAIGLLLGLALVVDACICWTSGPP